MTIWRRWRASRIAHFVRDYESHVRNLVRKHPLDEAMALAVGGGDYEGIGNSEVQVLIAAGLRADSALVDLGCGSGRLSKALGNQFPQLNYLGTDVVQNLLVYAKKQSPSTYRFMLHRRLSVPVEDESVDIVCAFSVFTHLFHQETFQYLRDAKRALKPGGALVFSFLEYSRHWSIFERMVLSDWEKVKPHLNIFIERPAIEAWALHLGLLIEAYDIVPFGQSVVLLRKPITGL